MAARFFRELKARGGDVVLEIAAPLTGLLGRTTGVDRVVALDPLREPPVSYDLWIPSMSIPYVLGFDPARTDPPRRYLAPSAESAAYWRERIARYAGRKVGIAWSGNPVHRNDLSRSIPFELVRPLMTVAGTQFFSLQLAPGWSPGFPKPSALIDFTEELFTFDDTAGLAECMDLIISVDTSVAHLAGALGKPTWVLVPYVAEWRWGLAGEACTWYPSITILRQPRPNDWAGLLRDVAARLSTP
jgi:hypothetical protein